MQIFYDVVTFIKKSRHLLCLVAVLLANTAGAQVRIVADLDPAKYDQDLNRGSATKNYSLHVTDGTRTYFVANGTELWTSNGTTDDTRVVKRFLDISATIVINGVCYFTAHTDDTGVELWKSNGTPGGTTLLKDIYQGRGNSTPSDFVKIGDVLYFSANNKVNGRELWKTDGTLAGTQLVADIYPGAASSGPNKLAALNNHVFFSADNGVDGRELWSSNGTPGGTTLLKDINAGINESTPQDLVAANGLLFFTAVNATDGRQLWTSNGTSAGTNLLKVINPGHTRMGSLTPANNLVFFEAEESEHGLELWRSDGTAEGTFMAKDITPGPSSSTSYAEKHLDSFGAVNGKLFFKAVSDGTPNLWMSDGTTAGTFQVPLPANGPFVTWMDMKFHDINGEAVFMAMSNFDHIHLYRCDMSGNVTLIKENVSENIWEDPMFASMNGLVFFLSREHYWKTDGTTAGTLRVKQTGIPGGSNPTQLFDLNGTLIFNTHGPRGLWRTEGDAASTARIYPDALIYDHATSANNLLFFGNYDSPWRTDGTQAGTYPLSGSAQYPSHFTAANGLVFFNARNSTYGEELWQTDGTTTGTHITKDIAVGAASAIPRLLLGTSRQLFFPVNTPNVGDELWRSDGTNAGTYLVKDINPGPQFSGVTNLVNFKDLAYFFAVNDVTGLELYRSDGTEAGTYLVKDFDHSWEMDFHDMVTLTATPDHLLFVAIVAGQKTLWRSDGTGAGTYKIADIVSQRDPKFLGNAGADAIIAMTFDTHIEIWKSDGTATGTRKVHTLANQYLTYPFPSAVVGNVLYFLPTHHANEFRTLWRTDGTTAGTYQIPFDGQVTTLAASGPYVYFAGASHKYGNELFLVDEGLAGAREGTQARSQIAEEVITTGLSHYPNPFASEFTVSLKGGDGEQFGLEIMNMNGSKVFERGDLACNTKHLLKPDWQNGVYVMRVKHNNRIITKKIVKTGE